VRVRLFAPPQESPARCRALLTCALVGLAVAASATPQAHAAVKRPIVYAVVIDGLDGDRVDQGATPFISSLVAGQNARSTYYQESRALVVAETNPNHTAMMTGAYGGASGIFSNTFALYAPLENEDSCKTTGPQDLTKMPTETSGENQNCLLAQTVFEAIRRQGNPDRLATAAIFGKPKLGRIFAGKKFDGKKRDVDHLWAPCDSAPDDDDYCGDVPVNPISGYAINDTVVMDEVIRTIREGVTANGTTKRPDFTFVNLHQVDSAGHAFGTMTGAYNQAIAMADDEIERLVGELRSRGEWQRTLLILLSDHSMDTTLTKTSMDEPFSDAGIAEDDYLVIGKSSVDLIYLANRTSSSRFALLEKMRNVALATPTVNEALYREPNPADGGAAHTMQAVHPAWRTTGARAPDLFLTHDVGGSFADPDPQDQPLPGHHGAPQTRDNFFALIGGGSYVRQQSLAGQVRPLYDDTGLNKTQAENVDVASTVMGSFGLFSPRHNRGRYLREAIYSFALPGRAAPSTAPVLSIRQLSAAGRARGAGSSACPPGTPKLRYRLSWTPRGGRYDMNIRTGGVLRPLLRRSRRTILDLSLSPRRNHRFALRMRSASDQLGPRRVRGIAAIC
jgi:hypothetical protein